MAPPNGGDAGQEPVALGEFVQLPVSISARQAMGCLVSFKEGPVEAEGVQSLRDMDGVPVDPCHGTILPREEPPLDPVRLVPAEPFLEFVGIRTPAHLLDRVQKRAFVLVQGKGSGGLAIQCFLVEILRGFVADRHDDLDFDAVGAQFLPEEFVVGGPVAERPVGPMAWIREDETHAVVRAHDGVESDVVKGAASEEPPRQLVFVESAIEEVLQLLRTGNEPVPVGIREQTVQREQAPPEQGWRSQAALVRVLHAEGAVEASPEDMAKPLR